MCAPDRVFIVGSGPQDAEACRRMSLEAGEECPLAMKDHTLHFDLPEDQGRMVDQTYYITNENEEVSSLAKKMLRAGSAGVHPRHHGRHHEGKDLAGGVLQPRARGRPGVPSPLS